MAKTSFPVPVWVRTLVCLAACLSVPALIYAGYSGFELSAPLVIAVGLFATRITGLAFRNETNIN